MSESYTIIEEISPSRQQVQPMYQPQIQQPMYQPQMQYPPTQCPMYQAQMQQRQQMQRQQQRSTATDEESSCNKILTHMENCKVCSRLYACDYKFYKMAIFMMTILIIILLFKNKH